MRFKLQIKFYTNQSILILYNFATLNVLFVYVGNHNYIKFMFLYSFTAGF